MNQSNENTQNLAKIHAANKALDTFVYDDMVIGVGTGSTVQFFIKALSERLEYEELELVCVPTSYDSHIELVKAGISVSSLIEYPEIDVCVDGADIITKNFTLIKGGGAALLMEKIVAYSSQQFIVIADENKYPKNILDFAVPVEIISQAINSVIKPIVNLGGELRLRYGNKKAGPIISDNGNVIGDIYFKKEFDPKKMEIDLNSIPGIIENGLFTNYCDKIVIGTPTTATIIDARKK